MILIILNSINNTMKLCSWNANNSANKVYVIHSNDNLLIIIKITKKTLNEIVLANPSLLKAKSYFYALIINCEQLSLNIIKGTMLL